MLDLVIVIDISWAIMLIFFSHTYASLLFFKSHCPWPCPCGCHGCFFLWVVWSLTKTLGLLPYMTICGGNCTREKYDKLHSWTSTRNGGREHTVSLRRDEWKRETFLWLWDHLPSMHYCTAELLSSLEIHLITVYNCTVCGHWVCDFCLNVFFLWEHTIIMLMITLCSRY